MSLWVRGMGHPCMFINQALIRQKGNLTEEDNTGEVLLKNS